MALKPQGVRSACNIRKHKHIITAVVALSIMLLIVRKLMLYARRRIRLVGAIFFPKRKRQTQI